MNKYERRRHKSAQAKQQQQPTAEEEEKMETETNAKVAQELMGLIGDSVALPNGNHNKDNSSSSAAASEDVVVHPRENEKDHMDELGLQQGDTPMTEAEKEQMEKDEAHEKEQEVAASKKTAKDEADHAAYMAEYHARPLELDRRNNATVRKIHKSNPKNNNASQTDHSDVFSNHTEWKDLALDSKVVGVLLPKQDDTTDTNNKASTTKFARPTCIQDRVIRTILGEREAKKASAPQNVWIQSETGSGKTLAYLLPIVHHLWCHLQELRQSSSASTANRATLGTRCIIICPTQELVQQTQHTCDLILNKLCAGTLVSGSLVAQTSRAKEKARIRKGLAVLISTPGRLLDHLKTTQALQTSVEGGKLQWLVLDEVDRLFDLGLAPQLQEVVQLLRRYVGTKSVTTEDTQWRSILVSATVPQNVQTLVQDCLSPSTSSSSSSRKKQLTWAWVQGDRHNPSENASSSISKTDVVNADGAENQPHHQGGRSLPKQLVQYHIMVSAKLRLTTLIAFLADRVAQGECTVVFLSTCASVDYYHQLFTTMECILGNVNDDQSGKGIFGKACAIHKLHGNIPHQQRQPVLQAFHGNTTKKSAHILLATDVAARGLNLQADWTVQYDPPCEIADYIHRAGRVARAGQLGHSLLFLLPSEKSLLPILQFQQQQQQEDTSSVTLQSSREMPALSLTSTLQQASKVCPTLTLAGMQRNGLLARTSKDKDASSDDKNGQKGHRRGEAFCSELQYRLEECVLENSKSSNNKDKAGNKGDRKTKKTGKDNSGPATLVEMARAAFLSHMRAYPTKEKLVRHIFSARALHLGHIAKSFALREPPKTLVKNSRSGPGEVQKKRSAALAFENKRGGDSEFDDAKRNSGDNNAGQKRAMLMANAAKLQTGSLESF